MAVGTRLHEPGGNPTLAPTPGKLHVGIIGGGIAGLVAGYDLAKAGAQVTIFERGQRMGGLAGSFSIGPGQDIEKYYHFICRPDKPYFDILHELGLGSRLHWSVTEMGLYFKGVVHRIGDPLGLLKFPYLSVGDKARFCWATAMAKFRNSGSWKDLEGMPAQDWLIRQYGKQTYFALYAPLLDLKFREYAPKISAAWMWARFHRLGNSRTITQREYLGYLDGGSQAFIDALEQSLRDRSASLRTAAPVEQVVVEEGSAIGVRCGGEVLRFDRILSTVPIPAAREMVSGVGGPYFDDLHRLEYIGTVVMLMRLRRKFSGYFWMNVSDPEIDLAGIIEYTNLNPCRHLGGDSLLYLPQYPHFTNPLYELSKEDLFSLYCRYLRKVNPDFDPSWVRDYWVHRSRFAQPICDLGFSKRMPTMGTPVRNLYLTDSYQLQPDDRSISGSIGLGRAAARLILSAQKAG